MKDIFKNLLGGNKAQSPKEVVAAKVPSNQTVGTNPSPRVNQQPTKTNNQVPASTNPVRNTQAPASNVVVPQKAQQRNNNSTASAFGTGGVPQARVPVKNNKTNLATTQDIERLLNFKGKVISAEGGTTPITSGQAMYVALLDQSSADIVRNELVISSKHYAHPDTTTAKSYLRQNGQPWVKETLVDMEVIHQIYAKHDMLYGKGDKARPISPGSEVAHRQKEFLNLIKRAADLKASDIHLTIGKNFANVRFRVDGETRKVDEMNIVIANELCQAAFAMADASDPTYNPMDYQGARVSDTSLKGAKFPEGVQSIRLQFNPLPSGGRYMVARLLYAQKVGSNSDVDELGYAPIQVLQIQSMRQKPFGINIISGPTGSGKSTTLQRGLTALMREKQGANVITIEDPPEYVIEGAAQLPVTNAKTADERSEKFRQAITAALRSDPDVIMIGEIRDQASSQLAFEAAMTGHGVWASLHANDGPSILDRLRDQKVEIYKLCDSTLITGLIGQRLLKKNKPDFEIGFEEGVEKGYILKDEEKFLREHASEYLSNIKLADTSRFDNPADAYAGRRVVAEVIEPDQIFLDFIRAEKKAQAVQHWKENLQGISMLEHAFALVCLGHIDVREMRIAVGNLSRIEVDRIPTIMRLVTG